MADYKQIVLTDEMRAKSRALREEVDLKGERLNHPDPTPIEHGTLGFALSQEWIDLMVEEVLKIDASLPHDEAHRQAMRLSYEAFPRIYLPLR